MSLRHLKQSGSDAPAGLLTLMDAYEYARDADRSQMDFAVEANLLKTQGLTDCDLRWLICRCFVIHGIETTLPTHSQRQFHLEDSLHFTANSCLALTPAGFTEFRHLVVRASFDPPAGDSSSATPLSKSSRTESQSVAPPGNRPIPSWCSDRRELVLAGRLVKRFRVPSPNQEAVLAAFQEEAWPIRIDDPLPFHCDIVPKRRLQDTIKSLNRNQKSAFIRFQGDGSGEGVIWQVLDSPIPDFRDAPG